MSRLTKAIGRFFEAFGVYLFTLIGILLSQYAPLLLKQGTIDTPFEMIRLGISAVVAFYIVATDETTDDPEGKKKNLKRRLAHAFTHGFTWNSIIGIAGQAAGQ